MAGPIRVSSGDFDATPELKNRSILPGAYTGSIQIFDPRLGGDDVAVKATVQLGWIVPLGWLGSRCRNAWSGWPGWPWPDWSTITAPSLHHLSRHRSPCLRMSYRRYAVR